MIRNSDVSKAMVVRLDEIFSELPAMPYRVSGIRQAPCRPLTLNEAEIRLSLKNALRYIPEPWHAILAPEFLRELLDGGRIYGYRFRPSGKITAKPVNRYRGNCLEGKAFQVMIDNNLDFDVALYPYELVTYGETGQVFQNWMQYRLVKAYLERMEKDQTLAIASGHPLGLFASTPEAPRVIITNSLMIGMYDDPTHWHKAAALGVANYGQMTAGGWMYIGPQGIVHGTYSTLLNAGRLKLNIPSRGNLCGRLFVSSGLGGMSGAQGKAIEIAGGVGIIAEVDPSRVNTRKEQGWVSHVTADPADAFQLAGKFQTEKKGRAIAFQGNIVDLLEHAVRHQEPIDLLSDQTSCHAVYEGGYCPQGLNYEERTRMLEKNPMEFRRRVDTSLVKHIGHIQSLVDRGAYFFDYGNSFLKAVFDAGVKSVSKNGVDATDGFIFPSYVEDIIGPLLFDLGYGPFRWVCLNGDPEDLKKTDVAAMSCIDPSRNSQERDNYAWIRDAEKNRLVVGTQARILYQCAEGRTRIALKFNDMVRSGVIGPVMLGRDHHDTGGTDSPFRETANIRDGSNIMADMAVQCFAGNAARGMSLVALHNGGGVGIGKAINGGFGLVLDGSHRVEQVIKRAISWDVMAGIARRAWARNAHAVETGVAFNETLGSSNHMTLPFVADEGLIESVVSEGLKDRLEKTHHRGGKNVQGAD